MAQETDSMTIAVDGATGYVGSHLIHELKLRGHEVHAIVHPGASELDIDFLQNLGAKIFKTDLNPESAALKEALAGVNSLVHLIGSIAPKKGEALEDLHAGQMKRIIESCRQQNTRIVLITALGSSATADSLYHRSKWQSEELLKHSGLPYVILQPSLILGRQIGRRNSKLIARYIHLLESRPRLPLVAGGKNLLQPIFIGDLCQAIACAAESKSLEGRIIELGGTDTISMRDLVIKLMNTLGKNKPLLAIPAPIAYAAASLLQLIQPVPLLSVDQVKLSLKDNICKKNEIENLLKHEPRNLDEALRTYKTPANSQI